MKKNQLLLIAIIGCVTIGLAPHSEPHIWKQIMNLVKGREMLLMDWLDVLLHGLPWLLLIGIGVRELKVRIRS